MNGRHHPDYRVGGGPGAVVLLESVPLVDGDYRKKKENES